MRCVAAAMPERPGFTTTVLMAVIFLVVRRRDS